MHVNLHALAGRSSAFGGIFRKILSFCRRFADWREPGLALAGRFGATGKPYLGLLLPHRAEDDIFGRAGEFSQSSAESRIISECLTADHGHGTRWHSLAAGANTFPTGGAHPDIAL